MPQLKNIVKSCGRGKKKLSPVNFRDRLCEIGI